MISKVFLWGSILFLILIDGGKTVYGSCPDPLSNQCFLPPFADISPDPPNILFVLDVSGSMSSCVYNTKYENGAFHCCDYYENCHNNYRGEEEGYFDPEEIYVLTPDFGNLEKKITYCEAVDGCYWDNSDNKCEGYSRDYGVNCNIFNRLWREAKCENFTQESECNRIPGCFWSGGSCTGNARLNMPDPNNCSNVRDENKNDCKNYWQNQVDYADDGDPDDYCPLIRAGIGKFKTRKDKNGDRYTFKGSCLNFHLMRRIDILRWAITGGNIWGCDIEDYKSEACDPDLSQFCNNETCILKPRWWYSYRGVEVPRERVYGVSQKAEELEMRPRLGAIFFNKDLTKEKVYLGDYPEGDTPADPDHPFTFLKRYVNAVNPYGGTGTVKAMWEAYDYFKQSNDHDYDNGFELGEGTYKDPLYICDANGNNCSEINYCTKNYIILISDGQWNQPGCGLNSDPVKPAYHLHTDDLRNINGHPVKIDKVYTIGLTLGGTGEKSFKNIAMYGSFDISYGDWPSGTNGFPDATCILDDCCKNENCGQGSGCEDIPTSSPDNCHLDWDKNCDGIPDTFYSAYNAKELKDTLFKILGEITATGSAGAVATVTQQVVGGDVVVRGAFRQAPDQIIWQGHLEIYWPYEGCETFTSEESCNATSGCYWINNQCQGTIYSFQLPANQGRFCSDEGFVGGHCWDAGDRLKNQTSRTIFTYLNREKKFLNSLDNSSLEVDMDFDGDGDIDNDDVNKLKNWIKGTEDGDGMHMRKRWGWILGDIVYSTPLVIGAPSLAAVSKEAVSQIGNCNCTCVENDSINENCVRSCFYCYRYKHLHRDKVVYVGANDGMLHAFLVGEWDENNNRWVYEVGQDPDHDGHKIGDELWAYIPSNLLSDLKCLAKPSYGTDGGCQHRTMVDLSPEAWDVYIDHDHDGDKEWRTVLIGGERGGGDVYFAIDVTDPHTPKVLWEYSVLRNMVKIFNGNRVALPYLDEDVYQQIKTLPASWSKPYVGRINIGGSVLVLVSSGSHPIGPFDESYTLANYSPSGWFAFIGGGARVFSTSGELVSGDNGTAFYPYFLALDVETGVNIFQFLWPAIRSQISGLAIPRNTNYIPYVMANPLVLDVDFDGYVDHIYLGDLNGLFWGIKLGNEISGGFPPLRLDIWKTKPIPSDKVEENHYRSDHQPITVEPAAALDPDENLWIYFGTGKFDDVYVGNNDKTDTAKMSFYAIKDTGEAGDTTIACTINGNGPPYTINCDSLPEITLHNCESFNEGCTWVKVDEHGNPSGPDCCEEDNCTSACFTCVYDFIQEGERVVDSALVAGGLVFVTTFVPSNDPCAAGGKAYLYAFDYNCGLLDQNPFKGSGLDTKYLSQNNQWQKGEPNGNEKAKAYLVSLGKGMPSRPVLESSGEHILIQKSTGEIKRVKVNLPYKPFYLKGWREK